MKLFGYFKVFAAMMFAAAELSAQTIWNGTANTGWYNESQTEFTITTAEQLAGLAQLVNNGNRFEGKTIKLSNNIMLNDTANWQNWENNPPAREWEKIGYWDLNSDNGNKRFQGTFDGCGYVVSGIYINSFNKYQGLFGYVGGMAVDNHFGTIKNLGVIASYVNGGDWSVALLVGSTEAAKITNCYTAGKVKGNNGVGGLVGNGALSYITNSYSTAIVEGYRQVGGLIGISDNYEISNCYAIGNVRGSVDAGGLIGTGHVNVLISNYYDKETSGQENNGWGEGKTTAEMKRMNTYIDWDFTDIWGINSAVNNGYPFLRLFGNDNLPNAINSNFAGQKTLSLFSFAGIQNGQIKLNLKAGSYTAQIYNLQGRLIKSVDINADGINAPTGLRIDNLSKGIFILNVKQAGVSVLKEKVTVK